MTSRLTSGELHTRPSLRTTKPALLMFIFGLCWSFSFGVGGRIFGGELLALMMLPFLRPVHVLKTSRPLQRVLLAYLLLLAGLVLSDSLNGTDLRSAFRGWANPLIASLSLVFTVALLKRDPRAAVAFLWSTFLANLLLGNEAFQANGFSDAGIDFAAIQEDSNIFKVRIVPFLLPAAALLLYVTYRSSKYAAFLIGLAVTILCFAFDARSAGLITFFAGASLLFIGGRSRIGSRTLIVAFWVTAAVIYIMYCCYVYYTLNYNNDGHSAKQIMLLTSPYNPLNILAIGRSEWLVAPYVISENPLFGYGSWAEDKDLRFAYMRALLTSSEATFDQRVGSSILYIPTHSILLGSWVWGGLLGFVGGIFLLVTMVRAFMRAMRLSGSFLPLTMFFAASVLWDIFFSPIQSIRLTLPVMLGFLLVISESTSPCPSRAINREQK